MTGLVLVTRQQENHFIFPCPPFLAVLPLLTLYRFFLSCPRDFPRLTFKLRSLAELFYPFLTLHKIWANLFIVSLRPPLVCHEFTLVLWFSSRSDGMFSSVWAVEQADAEGVGWCVGGFPTHSNGRREEMERQGGGWGCGWHISVGWCHLALLPSFDQSNGLRH